MFITQYIDTNIRIMNLILQEVGPIRHQKMSEIFRLKFRSGDKKKFIYFNIKHLIWPYKVKSLLDCNQAK